MAATAMNAPEEASASPPEWATIEQVFAALESPLLAYARRLLGDFGVAEDVVQDAFMKLHSQFHQVRTPQPWLYRTVHNLAVDHQRRASRILLVGDSAGDDTPAIDPADSQPMPDEQIARWEGIGLVRLVLETRVQCGQFRVGCELCLKGRSLVGRQLAHEHGGDADFDLLA